VSRYAGSGQPVVNVSPVVSSICDALNHGTAIMMVSRSVHATAEVNAVKRRSSMEMRLLQAKIGATEDQTCC